MNVYIEDSHSGAFYYLAEVLDLDEEYLLINIDAHPDTAINDNYSRIRINIQSVKNNYDEYTRDRTIQCDNWIHPLTPRPVSDLIWVPYIHDENYFINSNKPKYDYPSLNETVNGWFEGGNGLQISSLVELERILPENKNIVVSLDLDFFADSSQIENDIQFTLNYIFHLKNLKYLVIAISNAYLQNSKQLNDILFYVFYQLLENKQILSIRFEPFLLQVEDHSFRYNLLKKYGNENIHFSLYTLDSKVKKLLLQHFDQIAVVYNRAEWEQVLKSGN